MPSHFLDDEVLIITEEGGEMPEVTMHSSLHFLSQDQEGPRLLLAGHDHLRLKQAVVAGYRRIIVRDLTPENRDKGLYRGPARGLVNWRRLSRFCRREGLDLAPVATEVREQLCRFLTVEYTDVVRGVRRGCVNCSGPELLTFCQEVDLDLCRLPAGWQGVLCRG